MAPGKRTPAGLLARLPYLRLGVGLAGLLAGGGVLLSSDLRDERPLTSAVIAQATEVAALQAGSAGLGVAGVEAPEWGRELLAPYSGGEEAITLPSTASPGAAPGGEAPAGVATVMEPPPALEAAAFAVIERACGTLVWGENETERLAPASLTKIVTALVVRDMVSLNDEAESHVSAAEMKERGSSVMGVEAGMRLSVLDLLNGLLLKSGNDAALVLAEHAGAGSIQAFLDAMNQKAEALGMADSHFSNPHGLDQSGHYSSALDMAKAGQAFLEDPVLAEIAVTDEYWPDWEGSSLRNGNKLLQRYPGSYGVKIGYTKRADQTIVAAAERDGRHVIVSVLGSTDRYADATVLLDWAFTKTSPTCG
jgi:D-alanyl-D-alanine carboxypeptidase